ncbi:hypothetical protein FHS20_001321 [Phyllobacterium endophyticum]|nr:hypothetical protein [Phyllobacterium endophyticum]
MADLLVIESKSLNKAELWNHLPVTSIRHKG